MEDQNKIIQEGLSSDDVKKRQKKKMRLDGASCEQSSTLLSK